MTAYLAEQQNGSSLAQRLPSRRNRFTRSSPEAASACFSVGGPEMAQQLRDHFDQKNHGGPLQYPDEILSGPFVRYRSLLSSMPTNIIPHRPSPTQLTHLKALHNKVQYHVKSARAQYRFTSP